MAIVELKSKMEKCDFNMGEIESNVHGSTSVTKLSGMQTFLDYKMYAAN